MLYLLFLFDSKQKKTTISLSLNLKISPYFFSKSLVEIPKYLKHMLLGQKKI